MHKRLIFRNRKRFKHTDTTRKHDPGDGSPGLEKGTEIKNREVGKAGGEKRYTDVIVRPYRKPTQVDEERILRPTGEGLLRNSAY